MLTDEENDSEILELEIIARDYFLTGFPNPGRIDCPDKTIFQKLINEKKLPDENLQEHLLRCSECFQDYRSALLASREAVTEERLSFWHTALTFLHGRPKLALGTGLGIVLFCVGIFVLLNGGALNKIDIENVSQQSQKSANTERNNKESDSKANPAGTNKEEKEKQQEGSITTDSSSDVAKKDKTRVSRSGSQNKTANNVKDKLLAKNEIVADFDNEITRNIEQNSRSETNKLKLKAASNRLKIMLPKGSPKGEYEISVVDVYSNKLLTQTTWSRNGKTASITIYLKGVAEKADRLCLARKNEIPYCIPLRIE